MASVTLTTFMDYVVAAGTRKLTCVRKAKKQYGQGYVKRAGYCGGSEIRGGADAPRNDIPERAT